MRAEVKARLKLNRLSLRDLFDQVAQTSRRILCLAGLVVCRRKAINANFHFEVTPYELS